MESPESWNLLTGSLAFCELRQPRHAWAFLVLQGLVRDSENDRTFFEEVVRREIDMEITGPSAPCRIAGQLVHAGLALEPALTPDPWGKIAQSRMETVAAWKPSQP